MSCARSHGVEGGLADSLEPYFAPKRIDASRAEEPMLTEAPTGGDMGENETGVGEAHHFAGLLVDDRLDATEDLKRSVAIGHHLHVEPESAILLVLIDGAHDLVLGANLDHLARLQIQHVVGRWPLSESPDVRIGTSAPMHPHDGVESGDRDLADKIDEPHIPCGEVLQ